MAIARKQIVHPEHCRYYHIIGRCVRCAFLCGFDRATVRDYEHRRVWVTERLEILTQAFSIDVAGYAVLSSHYYEIPDTQSLAGFLLRDPGHPKSSRIPTTLVATC